MIKRASLLFMLLPSFAFAQTTTADPGQPVGAPPPASATGATNTQPVGAVSTQPSPGADSSGIMETPVTLNEIPPLTDEEAEWALRDRQNMESNSLSGSAGLLHMQHAQGAEAGQIRIGFVAEYFGATQFLCTPDFPCTLNGSKITSDDVTHTGGTLSIGVGITKWLEAYAATTAFANSNTAGRPQLLQVLGDSVLGVKGHYALSSLFHVGVNFDVTFINGTGSVGLNTAGLHIGPIATLDLRPKKLPMRFSVQGQYTLDNTGAVVDDVEAARGNKPITRVERFGLGVNRVDHFDVGLGAEFFAWEERIRPFVELNFALPTNRQNYLCRLQNDNGDHCLANDTVVPAKLTLGARLNAWKGLGFIVAGDIGVGGVSDFIAEVAPTPPWTLYFGASFNTDTQTKPGVSKTIEKVTEAKRSHIVGRVHEREKADGITGAIVQYTNHPDFTGLVTNGSGNFTTAELTEGKYSFAVKADGYKDGTCDGTITKDVADVKIDCALEALPKTGVLIGHVRDYESQAPVTNAVVKLVDANKKELSLGSDGQGNIRADALPAGNVALTVDAPGYMALIQQSDVKVRQDNTVDLLIAKKPKNALVQIGKKEITIKQQVQYEVDSAKILPASYGLLTEIADAFIKNPYIHRVEVQGHTDNSGNADHNKLLSEQRAQSVVDWLTAHGVLADRLVPRGYGQTKPLVPNVTTANKARNRRVQFIILDQDAPPAAPANLPPVPGKKDPFEKAK